MEVAVNKTEWNSLDATTQQTISSIIGSNFAGTTIAEGDAKAESKAAVEDRSLSFNLSNPFCDAACGIAEAAAVAACATLSGPALAVCIAAAHEAGNYCRSRC